MKPLMRVSSGPAASASLTRMPTDDTVGAAMRVILVAAAASMFVATVAIAQEPSTETVAPAFDPVKATDAYLATIPADERARSDAYFEGGYWLQLSDFLLGVGVNLAVLATGLSRRMRDLAERA